MADTAVTFQTEVVSTGIPADGAWAEDRALATSLRAGEEAAYEALILRYEQPVFGVVSRLLEDSADAPDVVHC